MISSENHGPVGRTFEEDDEEEYLATTSLLNQKNGAVAQELKLFKFNTNGEYDVLEKTTASSLYNPLKAIVMAFDHVASPYVAAVLSSLFGSLAVDPALTIKLSPSGPCVAEIFVSEKDGIMIVSVVEAIPDDLAHSFLSLILVPAGSIGSAPPIPAASTTTSLSIIALGSISIGSYVGNGGEGSLRKLTSSSISSSPLLGAAAGCVKAVTAVPPLEVGNVVTGTAAALLAHAEMHDLPMLLLVSVARAAASVASMGAFRSADEIFADLISGATQSGRSDDSSGNGSGQFVPPNTEDYRAAVRKDSYLANTENLYC